MALTHFAPNQTNSIKMKRQNHENPKNKQTRSRRAYEILRCAWDLARLFGKRTTLHGVNRLLGETEGRYERAVWFLTVVLAFAGSIYVCLILSRRFNEGKFQTVVDSTRKPVFEIYFPSVTICNWNGLNWDRIEEAKQRFLPNETSSEKLLLFEEILSVYDDVGFAKFDRFNVLRGKPLESLNHVNFSQVVNFMTWRCEEFLEKCEWRYTKINCCDIFSKRRTKYGLCWSFNTLETKEGRRMQLLDPMWPWRTGGAGPGSALRVRVLINPEKHNPKRYNAKGLSIIITEPYVWHKDPLHVPANTETMIEIEPVIYFYDNGTRSIPSDQRRCVFEDEQTSSNFKSLQNYIYMIENCQAECQQEYLMRYCNCSMDLLFPPGQYPPCKAKDLLCLAQNNDHFIYLHQPGEEKYVRNEFEGMICKCYRNCYSCNYLPDARSSFLPPEMRKNVSYVDLDAYFRFDTMLVYRTSLVFGWVDLMVAFGGIAGLFLGCSLISAMELAYFACIEMPSFIFNRVRCNRMKQVQTQDINATYTHRFSNQKFGGFIQRDIAKDRDQFQEYMLKNNAINTIEGVYRYPGLKPGHLATGQHFTRKTQHNRYIL